jgi:hypothetical protein
MTIIIWTKIIKKNLLRPIIDELNKDTVKDKRYTTIAITMTTNRFGPSGSFINKNIVLVKMIEVIPKINDGIFFEVRCMVDIVLLCKKFIFHKFSKRTHFRPIYFKFCLKFSNRKFIFNFIPIGIDSLIGT